MNPIIKFTTLFGLLAVEIAVEPQTDLPNISNSIRICNELGHRGSDGICFLVAAGSLVYRSFYWHEDSLKSRLEK